MIVLLALAFTPLAQQPSDQPGRLQPLVPAPEHYQPSTPGAKPPSPPVQRVPPPTASIAAQEVPRIKADTHPLPFSRERPLLRINELLIDTQELNQLVTYLRSFRSGSDDLLLQDAVKALLPTKVLQSKFPMQLAAMKLRIQQARDAVLAGEDFASVVSNYSEDHEAPTADGRYTFGRNVAVQPFDRISFTTQMGSLSEPFLTVYGYHFLQVMAYAQGDKPKDDQVTMRHVLIMYPELLSLEAQGKDVRTWIKQQVKAARIEVLDEGMQNLVPPENRTQIVKS